MTMTDSDEQPFDGGVLPALLQIQAMDAIGRLTGSVAHDFNDILTVIVNNLDMLKRNVQGTRALAMIENAESAASRGGLLIGQLLAFARQQALKPVMQDLNELLRGLEASLRDNAGAAVGLTVETPALPLTAEIDSAHLESALLNLVINARDAMPRGGRIAVTLAPHDIGPEDGRAGLPPGRYARLAVADTGEGMSEDVQRRAFEPFFTTKDIGKGSGLGLSQVYGFAVQSGGAVDIDSRMGAGTTVALLLPLHESQAGAAVADEPGAEAPNRHAVSALIVEDDPGLLLVAVELFRDLGFDVRTAGDSGAALEALRANPQIKLMFSDIVMPRGMNGVELAREAKAINPEIKILLASGYPRSALKARGLTDDMAFIGKPYRWSDLADQMRDMKLIDYVAGETKT